MLESRYKFCIPYYEGCHYEFRDWLVSGQGMDYLSISMYASMYKAINAFFPKENIHFLFFEDLKHDPRKFYDGLYKILEISQPDSLDLWRHSNPSLSEPELRAIKKLNRFKIFRGDSRLARLEMKLFMKLASRLRDPMKQEDEFRWGTSNFHENIERDFRIENAEMCKSGVFPEARAVQQIV